MKNILVSLFAIAALSFAASAQTFQQGDRTVGIDYGFKTKGAKLPSSTVGVSYEYGLVGLGNVTLGIGINGLGYGYDKTGFVSDQVNYKDVYTFICTGRLAAHFSPFNGLDLYIGATAGAKTRTEKYFSADSSTIAYVQYESKPTFVYSGVLGLRYYISNTFGIGVEGALGTAQNTVSTGIFFKF